MFTKIIKRHVSADTNSFLRSLQSKNYKLKLESLPSDQKRKIEAMIRVNQAGELGAVRIYQGQLAVLSSSSSGHLLRHMQEQEKVHRNTFNQIIAANSIRPTLLTPLWHVAGFTLGAATALMGKESAMMCTEAVETVIGDHYNDQIRTLFEMEKDGHLIDGDLKEVLTLFRNEELEHLDRAVENDAQKAPLHSLATSLIKLGCKVAITISEKI